MNATGYLKVTIAMLALGIALILLTGCGGTVIDDHPGPVIALPVRDPCRSGGPTAITTPLKQRFSVEQWAARTTGQKAALVGAQALRRINEIDGVRAETAGCP